MGVFMKLCVLNKKIDEEYLYTYYEEYLYYWSIAEYKKQILKGNISACDNGNARICYHYALNVLEGRFELGEESISKSGNYSSAYALYVLYDRFILGEEAIKQSSHRSVYEKRFGIVL